MNYLDQDSLRVEIAILQDDIQSKNPGEARFVIPVLMGNDGLNAVYVSNRNLINKNSEMVSAINITEFSDTITLKVPIEYTYFYGSDIVPKGTRFLIAFVGGNYNDIKIIGRYDDNESPTNIQDGPISGTQQGGGMVGPTGPTGPAGVGVAGIKISQKDFYQLSKEEQETGGYFVYGPRPANIGSYNPPTDSSDGCECVEGTKISQEGYDSLSDIQKRIGTYYVKNDR